MDTVKKGWKANQEKISAALETMKQEMDREDVLESDLRECRLKIQQLGSKVSEMLCPLEVGKMYRVKPGAMLDWTRVGGRHFRVVKYVSPRRKDDKWSVYVNWFNKKGERFRVYGNEIIGVYISSDFAENIEEIP